MPSMGWMAIPRPGVGRELDRLLFRRKIRRIGVWRQASEIGQVSSRVARRTRADATATKILVEHPGLL